MSQQQRKIVPVILSGGSGSRLWPLSREGYPKQFLPLQEAASLLQNTVLRLQGLSSATSPIVVCNQAHRFLVAEQLHTLSQPSSTVILEPIGRNTAPAVAIAALAAQAVDDDPLLLVLPADHVIADVAGFQRAVEQATRLADQHLITFGITPTAATTGFGYIQQGTALAENIFRVKRFVEKPDRSNAEHYLADGGYFWNSGMFLFRAALYLTELERLHPDMLTACRAAYTGATHDLDFVRLDNTAFKACPSDSIDYAVMEKTSKAAVMPLTIGWSDVGAWSSLWSISERDADGNAVTGDVMTQTSHNCYLYAQHRLLATVGIDDLVVIETADAVLVASKEHVQDVKSIVERLKSEHRSEYQQHRKVYRPWGAFDSIDHEERFQVKRISVKPGASLSLQMHHHRAEHWIVVKGTAEVQCDERRFLLHENESTFIPAGGKHRLSNPGKIPLELIEVQSGSYLGEDDIIRFDDRYGRDSDAH